MAARILMSGANLVFFAVEAGAGGEISGLALPGVAIAALLAVTVIVDKLWLGPDAGWPVLRG